MVSKDILFKNNTGNKSKVTIVDSFVVRTNELTEILKTLEGIVSMASIKNKLIIGQRGAGKTTLIYRLNYAILDDANLSDQFLPIIFSEEQYHLSDLTNLWETVASYVDDNFYKENLANEVDKIIETEKHYEVKSWEHLRNFFAQKNKIAILFIENFNSFLKKLNLEEKGRLKSILIGNNPIKIIATSTSYNDGSIDFADPYFDFLEIYNLEGLSQLECEMLLLKLGEQYGESDQIKVVIENHPGRIESLRRLTGGIPRIISYLFQIFLDNENGKAIRDLYLLIDNIGLLYKSEIDQLSPQQQKVIDAIARKWDAISVKEIVKKTRLESKNISTILSNLEKNQIVEKLVLENSKNNLYRIRERFMNIWYLMRFGRKLDKDNVIWLVRFFDAWCDESELTRRVKRHIANLKKGNYDQEAAIDMRNTFLSCENISEILKEELIKTTESVLPKKLLRTAKKSPKENHNEIRILLDAGKFEEAKKKLSTLTLDNIDDYIFAASVNLLAGDERRALELASLAWNMDNQNSFIAVTLGVLYDFHLKDDDKAIEFYKKSLDLPQPHSYAANRLGEIYRKLGDHEKAIEYHKKAVKKFRPSLISLGEIFMERRDFVSAEKYLLEAKIQKVDRANLRIARMYTKMGKEKETEQALIEAINAGEERSHIKLGRFYSLKKRPSSKKAEFQFLEAIRKGDTQGYNELAKLYLANQQLDKAIKTLEQGLSHNSTESAHQLGHIYSKQSQFDLSDKMFSKALDMGDIHVIPCWVSSMYSNYRVEKKKFALELMEKYRDKIEFDNLKFKLVFAKILLWNNELEKSSQLIKEQAKELFEMHVQNDEDDVYIQRSLSDLAEYFILLIALKEYEVALEFFQDDNHGDIKVMLKPLYFLLMGELKERYPSEYLKAGAELKETINELKKEVKEIREKL